MTAKTRQAAEAVSLEQLREFEERGLLVIPNALSPQLLERLADVHDRIYREEEEAGRLSADGSLHLLAFVDRDELYAELLDLPATFRLVCTILGWNIFMYHCHLDVHPPTSASTPLRWRWHQDGGRQNLEAEAEPTRPRLSVKVAYFLSDVSEPGRGNLTVVPGSHTRNTLPRPEGTDVVLEHPVGAEPICAAAGSAVILDRRLWHARGDNHSNTTRKVLFMAYTYRWIRPRDDHRLDPAWWNRLSPVRRQLLGASTSVKGCWLPSDEDAPLRACLEERGLLQRSRPAHR